MATIALTSAVSTLTSGTALSFAGAYAPLVAGSLKVGAKYLGTQIDNQLFGNEKTRNVEGRQLSNLAVQSSAYGEMIPKVYGTVRIAGNIIWSQPIKETAHRSSNSTGGGKGGATTSTTNRTDYSYSATLAVGLCEGEIDEVVRVWADAELINPDELAASYTVYTGSETQLADSTIESFEGVGNVPAHRGLAYVVFEDFQLERYGNRIPNFTFEVRKKVLSSGASTTSLEEKITSMVLIPGSGEFVYSTDVQYKVPGEEIDGIFYPGDKRIRVNQNNSSQKADVLVALDQLQATCPNLEWISVVVTWFGDSLDIANCTIEPQVEFKDDTITEADAWEVAGYTRDTATKVTYDGGVARYGGTPSDASLVSLVNEIQDRGLKVMVYPMIFMDVVNKPWRGRMTGDATDVSNFFSKSDGYNRFIEHYADLLEDKIDAFVIGSEMVGLTTIQDGSNNFPAVNELVSLAATVKTTLGNSVKVTYAADWSEYHHDENGWYHLDPLWASSNIDMVGIDAYFPITDQEPGTITYNDIVEGWTSGEGYDWYYSDEARTTKEDLADEYAWKNLSWWWNNAHTNPDLSTTSWVAQSKPIWFTEYGFPSVDGASNQPNVFYDTNSSESSYPRFSRGRVDFAAQRKALEATEEVWENSTMVERRFVWTWDARPYPFWPELYSVWADGDLWQTGHWVNGKLGLSPLSAVVATLCAEAGLEEGQYDTTDLKGLVHGFVLQSQLTARKAIEELQKAYFFDAVEEDGVLSFKTRGSDSVATIDVGELIPKNKQLLQITRVPNFSLPQQVNVTYLNRVADYQVGSQISKRSALQTSEQLTVNIPIVFTNQEAKTIADTILYNSWVSRTAFKFCLPISYIGLSAGDVVDVETENATHRVRILSIEANATWELEVRAVAEDASSYDFYNPPAESDSETSVVTSAGNTNLTLLDLPLLPSDESETELKIAISADEVGWHGAVVYRSSDGGVSYETVAATDVETIMGLTTSTLAQGVSSRFDEQSTVDVMLEQGELESKTALAVLNGANAALIGDEIIQFKTATLLSSRHYRLSGLLRGRRGTEHAMTSHNAGERFVLLDSSLVSLPVSADAIGLERPYKAVSVDQNISEVSASNFSYNAIALKPFSPAHIKASRDASGNISLSWVRRARKGAGWLPYADVALDEIEELYDVEIYDGSNVVRIFENVNSTNQAYSAAQQIVDFGSPQSSVLVKIYQRSSTVGRGYAGEAVV